MYCVSITNSTYGCVDRYLYRADSVIADEMQSHEINWRDFNVRIKVVKAYNTIGNGVSVIIVFAQKGPTLVVHLYHVYSVVCSRLEGRRLNRLLHFGIGLLRGRCVGTDRE